MKAQSKMEIAEGIYLEPGEIVAVTGSPEVRAEFLRRLAASDEFVSRSALLNFAGHAGEAQRSGWPQARYYEDEGKTVEDFLSYNDVWEINPFEIGAKRPESRKTFNARRDFLFRLLELRPLRESLVIALSNGETRRVLFARALAKWPELLLLDDPAAGLDPRQRAKLKDIISALAARGMTILIAARHDDEIPDSARRELAVGANGKLALSARSSDPVAPKVAPRKPARKPARRSNAEPVVEINHLDLAYGSRELFHDFSWTVRKGERWILRGENGSGKTTLLALITGDSPLAYAADIKVFGQSRDIGCELAKIRARIGVSSPEIQAYLGREPLELLDEALDPKKDLLLLDEPFMNLDDREAKAAGKKISAFLRAHRDITAILICHRLDEAPTGFSLEMNLDDLRASRK